MCKLVYKNDSRSKTIMGLTSSSLQLFVCHCLEGAPLGVCTRSCAYNLQGCWLASRTERLASHTTAAAAGDAPALVLLAAGSTPRPSSGVLCCGGVRRHLLLTVHLHVCTKSSLPLDHS